MSAFSQFSGGLPVGASIMMPDLAPIVTLTDSSVWLRSGVFVSPASYPRAAALPHLKAISASRINYTFGAASSLIASDGAGVILATNGGVTTNLERSTDGGVTWATVNVAGTLGGFNPRNVYRFNGKFWAVANDGAAIYVCESVTGATGTWTQRTVTTGQGNLTPSTAMLDWTGTNLVLAVQSLSATISVFTSPTGVTWTSRTLPFALNSVISLAASATGGIVVAQSASSYCVSTDHGATWGAARTAPTTGVYRGVFCVGNRFYSTAAGGVAHTTTPDTDTSWVRVPSPVARHAAATSTNLGVPFGFLSADRSYFYSHSTSSSGASGLLRFDANGNVEFRTTDRDNFSNTNAAVLVESGRTLFLNGTTNSSRAACDFDTVNALSGGYEVFGASSIPQASYTRVA